MHALNSDYSGAGLAFAPAGVTRTENVGWFNNVTADSDQETTTRASLRVGDASRLDVYTIGHAYLP